MKANNIWGILLSAVMFVTGCVRLNESKTEVTKAPADIFPGQDKLPILAWYSVPAPDMNLERFLELKDAGFNLCLCGVLDNPREDSLKQLDLVAEAGIQCLLHSWILSNEEDVKAVMNHPGLGGYSLADEPAKSIYDSLLKMSQRISAVDKKHTCYVNLLPTYAFKSLGEYRDYVRDFTEKVPLDLISFDHYPIVNGELRWDFYANLEIIAEEAKRLNLPFWAFALATAHGPYPVPDVASLKLQMYSNLAYGAQGLQYFTYWNPTTETWNFHVAPITLQKKRSSVYDRVREVNQELQARAFVFAHSKVISVCHVGTEIPTATKRLAELPPKVTKLDTHDKGAVVSLLEKNDKRYLVIVNRSLRDEMELTITFEPGVIRIRKDGTKVDADKYMDTLLVEPGECEIFEL